MLLKIFSNITRLIFILCIPVLLFTISIAWGFNSLWLYKYGFQKYGVSQTTGLAASELDKVARGLIGYFNSTEDFVRVTVTDQNGSFQIFNEEEQLHFKDVKNLVWLDYGGLLFTLLVVVAYTLVLVIRKRGPYWQQIARNAVWGSGLTLVIILILGIASFLDFDQLFLQMHYLMFPGNQYWSASGYMLMLFPGGFWYDAALICIGFMGGLAVIIGGSTLFYLLKSRQKHALAYQ